MSKMISHISCLVCFLAFCLPAGARTIYVDVDATGGNNGTSWRDAHTSLSAAISSASDGDEIWAAEGTYGPVHLKNGVKLHGGFAGTESGASAGDPDAHKTYISGGGISRAVMSMNNDSSAVLRGFYITEGFIDFPEMGGGLYLEKSDAMFVQCVFTRNKAATLGGAAVIWGGSPTFVNCKFYDNDGGLAAGAVFSRRSASPTFVNCLFAKNKAWEAGAVSVLTGAATFINCTIADNKATIGKAGALFDGPGEAVLRNCILWNNVSPVEGTSQIYDKPAAGGATTVTYSAVQGGWRGTENIDSDPLFVASSEGDYRLQAGSPCRDGGRDASLPLDVTDIDRDNNTTKALPKDLALNPRIDGPSVDVGAYEWHLPGG